MLRNYLKIALRQLNKQKMYSAIKIGGFALSIAACLLIALFIRDELRFDRSYPDGDRIYRIIEEYNDNGTIGKGADMQAAFARVLKSEFPEVEKSGRLMPHPLFYGAGSNEVMRGDKELNTYEEGFTYADQEFLDIFHIPIIYGSREHALDEPNTLVLSKRKADKYFPHENPVGRIIYLNKDKSRPFKIGAVMENFPSTSHIQYDFLLTLKGVEFWQGEQNYWGATNYYTYVLLRPGANAAKFESKLSSITRNYVIPQMVKDGYKDAVKRGNASKYHVQQLSDIHLRSYDMNIQDTFSHGDIRFVWLFGGIACFILFIACINFINLSTARSANRAREVGLRKVVGSRRIQLVEQFLTESALLSLFSFVLAILTAWALLPYFNTVSGKLLVIPWKEWWLLPVILLAASLVGILAGVYPSFYLSSFKPIQVLKGQLSRGTKNAGLRSVLVVFQFTTSIVLIISTVIIYRQMQYILHRKTGFDKQQVLLIQGTNTLGNEVVSFKNELKKLPLVRDASVSDYLPVTGSKRNGNQFWKEGKQNEESGVGGQFWVVDENYIHTMGMRIVEGRNFSREMLSDTQAVIINQEMVKNLNLVNPVGKMITNGYGAPRRVIGVVEDFNFDSMRGNIKSLSMILGISPSVISVKVNPVDLKAAIASIGSLWKKFSPQQPIRYIFLDESFASMYSDVERMGKLFSSFAFLAIMIACLGLFAMSAFMAQQRRKEISIRKVLGASVTQVTTLLSKDFVKLILISILIASPVAWWAMHKWLQDFVYRTAINGWLFLAAGLLVVIIALATISFQSIKAAISNPVKSLRSDG
ncbi:ABC transporter permease [Flavitalea flava]